MPQSVHIKEIVPEVMNNFVKIRISKCLLLATKNEFARMVNRGKWYLRGKKTKERQEQYINPKTETVLRP